MTGPIGGVSVSVTPDARDFWRRFEEQTAASSFEAGRRAGNDWQRGFDESVRNRDTVRIRINTGDSTARLAELQRQIDGLNTRTNVGAGGRGRGMTGLITLLGTLAPALVPLAGAVTAFGGAFGVLGGTAALAAKGIEAAVKAGGPLKRQFDQLKKSFGGLEQTAARGIMPGLEKALGVLQRNMPLLNRVIGQAASTIDKLLPSLTRMGMGILRDLQPVLKVVDSALVSITNHAAAFFNSPAGKSFGQTLAQDFKIALPVLGKIGSVLGSLLSALNGPGQAALKVIGILASGLQRLASAGLFKTLGDALTSVLTSLQPVFKQIVNLIVDLVPIVKPILKTIAKLVADLAPFFAVLLRQIGGVLKSLGPEIGPMLRQLAQTFKQFMVLVEQLWKALGPTVISQLKAMFRILIPLITDALKVIQDVFRIFSDIINGKWGDLWKRVKDLVANVWKLIVGIIKGAWDLVWNGLSRGFDSLKALFSHLWDAIVTGVKDAWHTISGWFSTGVASILGFLQHMGRGVASVFDAVGNSLSRIYNDTIRPLVAAYQTAASILSTVTGGGSLGFHLGHMPFPSNAPPHADGGLFRGKGGPRSDSNLVRVSDREFIVNAKQTARNLPLLDAINRGAKGFAGGGLVGLARSAGWSGRQAEIAAAIAMAESGGNAHALNNNPSTGDLSYGEWQINMIGSLGPARRREFGISSNAALFNPQTNARAAHRVFMDAGGSFSPWSTYNSGAYQQYLGNVGPISNGGSGGGGSGSGSGSTGPTPAQQRRRRRAYYHNQMVQNRTAAISNIPGEFRSLRGSLSTPGSEKSAFYPLLGDVRAAGASQQFIEHLRDENAAIDKAIRARNKDTTTLARDVAKLHAVQQKYNQEVSAISSAVRGSFDITSAGANANGAVSGGRINAQAKQEAVIVHKWGQGLRKLTAGVLGKSSAGRAMLRQLFEGGPGDWPQVDALLHESRGELAGLARSEAAISRDGRALGRFEARHLYGHRLRQDQRNVRQDRRTLAEDKRFLDHLEAGMERGITRALKHLDIKIDPKGVARLVATGEQQLKHSGRRAHH